jgi:hypothetical protein
LAVRPRVESADFVGRHLVGIDEHEFATVGSATHRDVPSTITLTNLVRHISRLPHDGC